MTIAQTILEQLGGNRFMAMTGAGPLVGDDASLTVHLPRGLRVRVTLDPTDTYTVETFRVRGLNVTPKSTTDGVHVESLRDVFTSHTGLRTSL